MGRYEFIKATGEFGNNLSDYEARKASAGLDEEIRPLLMSLNRNKLYTIGSCAGHIGEYALDELIDGTPTGYICFKSLPTKGSKDYPKLVSILKKFSIKKFKYDLTNNRIVFKTLVKPQDEYIVS